MTKITRRNLLALAAASPVALAATTARAATHAVSIEGFAFNPANLTIAAGDIVTFTNNDGAPHTATADNGGFDTGRLNRGDASSIQFDAAGTYSYYCAIHRRMTATITVT